MIELRSISKFYGAKAALDDLSFQISEGETVGILGLNGAGKSTALKILSGLLLPSSGEVFVGNYSVSEAANEVRKLIGFLPEQAPLYQEMRVDAYLKFAAKLKGVAAADIDTFVDEAMRKTNLTLVAERRVSELSHGFKQRVGIAQALVHKPKVLILDEPINGLDPIQIVEMRDLIVSLKSQHTVLLSSHILSEITKTCDRILVIDSGRLVAEGSEASLRGERTNFDVEVEWRGGPPDLAEQLFAQTSTELLDRSILSNSQWVRLRSTEDRRSSYAKRVVESGAELLSLHRVEDELESLFLKLISKEQ